MYEHSLTLIEALHQHAASMPKHIALKNETNEISYKALLHEVIRVKFKLNESIESETIALSMDNHPSWAIIDIASNSINLTLVPLPTFFSDEQILHAVKDAGVQILITDNPDRFSKLFDYFIQHKSTITVMGKRLMLIHLKIKTRTLPDSTNKITYTSGTTGQPKGVCLSEQAMLNVASAIKAMVGLGSNDQHLCVLPLSTLLENVAGLYATLLAGGTAHILPSEKVGLNGSSLNINQLLASMINTHASTAILIPELLAALVATSEVNKIRFPDLRFLAVGGASVAPDLLKRARRIDLPVFEGYGLSESASVVALNIPSANKIGSVGKLLPHLNIQFSSEHEILVQGANYLGYTNKQIKNEQWLNTGDIGYLDDEGYLFINGRKKNIFITSYGRNVSPEWVERDLTNSPMIAQACLFGEAKPWNVALIVPTVAATDEKIVAAINKVNQHLPDYARVSKWLFADEHFSVENQQLTPNGRLKRDVIWQQYHASIDELYTKNEAILSL